MGVNVRGRSFLTLLDFTPDEIRYFLELSAEFKRLKANGVDHSYLKGKQVVLLFEKTSTRTRCAFEVGARDLGMGVTFLDSGSSQMGKKESLEDTAKVLGRMYDGIEYRGFDQKVVEDLAKYSGVPVWNGLTDLYHPTQMLADILTVKEEFGDVRGRKLTFFGDARNNVANSLMVVCAKLGMHKELMAMAKPTAIFLHCLPSFHDRNTTVGEDIYQKYGLEAMEVTDDVFLGKHARQFHEAENRMHTIKAVMYATLK